MTRAKLMLKFNDDAEYLNIKQLESCKNIGILQENIKLRELLVDQMVGNLYPAIIEQEIIRIKDIIKSL